MCHMLVYLFCSYTYDEAMQYKSYKSSSVQISSVLVHIYYVAIL